MTQRSVVSVYEGNDVQLTCILSKNYPAVTEITWYNNMKQKVGDSGTPKKYVLQQAAAWSNLTVRETDGMVDGGEYWCSATNAVGGAEIPILLVVLSECTTSYFLNYFTTQLCCSDYFVVDFVSKLLNLTIVEFLTVKC